jgi:fatty acid desaturase
MEKNQDIQIMRRLLAEFHDVRPVLFWRDLILNALIGYSALAFTIYRPNVISLVIATIFIYRGCTLLHEVSHLAKKIKGYRIAYNILFGWAFSYPAYIFDTHLFHHGKKTYGTDSDPEYKFIPRFDHATFLRPIVVAVILPLFQWYRFGILPLIEHFMSKEKKRNLYQTLSALVFSMEYRRKIKDEQKDLRNMVLNDLATASVKVITVGLIVAGILPLHTLVVWYLVTAFASVLNMYRALLNHLYTNESNQPLSWQEHLNDTTTIEPGLITNIVCANGLNYHAIHHLFPELPYTNLAAAHQKLMKELPADHLYRQNVFNSIFDVMKEMREITIDRELAEFNLGHSV